MQVGIIFSLTVLIRMNPERSDHINRSTSEMLLNKGDKDSDDSTGTVSINNTEGLTVKKLWVYSNGTPMEAESIPLDKITYKLYGITQNSQQVELYTGTLTSDGNWKEVVPSEYLKDEYVSYRVEEYLEDLTAEEKLQLYGYKISCTGVSNGNTGEFTITNKNNTPSEIEVNVEKEWGRRKRTASIG